jgi:hypothetical protein
MFTSQHSVRIPEDLNLYYNRCENIKSHNAVSLLLIFLNCVCLQDKTAVCCLLDNVVCVLYVTPLFLTCADNNLFGDTFVKNIRSGVVTELSVLSYNTVLLGYQVPLFERQYLCLKHHELVT